MTERELLTASVPSGRLRDPDWLRLDFESATFRPVSVPSGRLRDPDVPSPGRFTSPTLPQCHLDGSEIQTRW